MMHLSSQLNEKQLEAVQFLEGAALVLAGAGSGKTKVVTARIVHLIENGVPPSAILGLTFTNKAALEMKERVAKTTSQQVLISTFHSLGVRILRETISILGYPSQFTIFDEEDSLKILKATLSDLSLQDEKCDIKALRQLISRFKNALMDPDQCEELEGGVSHISFSRIYARYGEKLKESGGVDFDDLLALPVKIWQTHPNILESYQDRWPFLLIDEYQDTNGVQYTLLRLLAQKRGNIFAVGDPDQSIYSWRGANVENILNFEKDYEGAQVIRLEQNYRSSTHILNAANALIANNMGRYKKKLWSHLGEGEKIKLCATQDEGGEAQFIVSAVQQHQKENISLNEMVVFYRTHAQSRLFEDKLMARGIPYRIVGGISFYHRREIKDVLAFIRIAASLRDVVSFTRTINVPKRGLGETTIDKLVNAASHRQMPIISFCQAFLKGEISDVSIRLSAKQKSSLSEYLSIIENLRTFLVKGSVRDIVMAALERTGYVDYLKEEGETFKERKENLDSLILKAIEWDSSTEKKETSLETFLEEITLKSSLDEAGETKECLSLMTLHNGKGLEFEVAFIAGLEENLFPHVNAKDSEAEIEEERRLCYVGITRAKKYLYLSYCRMRYLWGVSRTQFPSRFLKEIPLQYIEKVNSLSSISFPSRSDCATKKEEKPSSSFEVGEKLFHKEFGIGQVKEVNEGSLGTMYKIFFFKDKAEKTLVAKYAMLMRL